MPPTAKVRAERYSPLGRTLGEKIIHFNVIGDRTHIHVENHDGSGQTVNMSARTSDLKLALIILFDDDREKAKAVLDSYEQNDDQEQFSYQGAAAMADALLGEGWADA